MGPNLDQRANLVPIACIAAVLQLAFVVGATGEGWTNAVQKPFIAANIDPLFSTVAAAILTGNTRPFNGPKQTGGAATVELHSPLSLPSHASTLIDVEPHIPPQGTRLTRDRAPPLTVCLP